MLFVGLDEAVDAAEAITVGLAHLVDYFGQGFGDRNDGFIEIGDLIDNSRDSPDHALYVFEAFALGGLTHGINDLEEAFFNGAELNEGVLILLADIVEASKASF